MPSLTWWCYHISNIGLKQWVVTSQSGRGRRQLSRVYVMSPAVPLFSVSFELKDDAGSITRLMYIYSIDMKSQFAILTFHDISILSWTLNNHIGHIGDNATLGMHVSWLWTWSNTNFIQATSIIPVMSDALVLHNVKMTNGCPAQTSVPHNCVKMLFRWGFAENAAGVPAPLHENDWEVQLHKYFKLANDKATALIMLEFTLMRTRIHSFPSSQVLYTEDTYDYNNDMKFSFRRRDLTGLAGQGFFGFVRKTATTEHSTPLNKKTPVIGAVFSFRTI